MAHKLYFMDNCNLGAVYIHLFQGEKGITTLKFKVQQSIFIYNKIFKRKI